MRIAQKKQNAISGFHFPEREVKERIHGNFFYQRATGVRTF